MAKKTKSSEVVSFEESLAKLEEIVRQLEEGQLGLSESLSRYEEGVRHLNQCHAALTAAEQKIQLLTSIDDDGDLTTKPFETESLTLDEKQQARGRRRTHDLDDADADSQKGLF
ncbi:MAG: exodeoxyribonuclease VII small subunit [Planctomycetaceae bacterium]|nr:exodeoxyribonuclease VII small subunit [Planctomycetaceae bacterium]